MTSYLNKQETWKLECLLKKKIIKSQLQEKRLQRENIQKQEKEKIKEEIIQKKQIDEENKRPKTYKDAALLSFRRERTEVDRKLFVGKLKFNDLKGKETLLFTRKSIIKQMLTSFGEVEEFRCFWEKEYIFVIYKKPESATAAYKSLMDFNQKKQLCTKFQQDKLSQPKTNFYVRWPN